MDRRTNWQPDNGDFIGPSEGQGSKNVSDEFNTYWKTSMKILYLKGHKWLLSHNQRVRNDFFRYWPYETLAKHIKPFFKKTFKWKDVSALTTKGAILIYQDSPFLYKNIAFILFII